MKLRVQVYVRKFKLCMKQVNITFSLLAALNLSSEKAIVKIKSILLITDSKWFFNSVSLLRFKNFQFLCYCQRFFLIALIEVQTLRQTSSSRQSKTVRWCVTEMKTVGVARECLLSTPKVLRKEMLECKVACFSFLIILY